MTAKIAEPCWILPSLVTDEPHFASQQDAERAAPEWGASQPPRQLDRPCITLTCVCCETTLDEDDDGVILHLAESEVEATVAAYEWTRDGEGWRCQPCGPEGDCDCREDREPARSSQNPSTPAAVSH